MQSDSIIVTRKQALAAGLTRYFTGKPCKRGHIADRLTSAEQCVECHRISQKNCDPEVRRANKKRHYEKRKDHIADRQRKYYLANLDKVQATHAEYHKKHKDRINANTRRWVAENKDRKAASDRAYVAANAEHVKARRREYSQANARQINERCKAWYERNREREYAIRREYQRLHPEQYREYRRNQKAARALAPGKHSAADVRAIWARQDKKCAVPDCEHPIAENGKLRFHVDHIIALTNGGTNWPHNLQILCPTHNIQKRASDDIEWAQRICGTLFVL